MTEPSVMKKEGLSESQMKYTVFRCGQGWVGALSSSTGLRRLTLPQSSRNEALKALDLPEKAQEAPELFAALSKRLQAYFMGQKTDFPDELDLQQATPFQRRVWEATKRIPCGETRSYIWVAQQAGCPRGARAAGQALGRNPVPIIIPCHRVLASNGKLGGFTGGLKVKESLLNLEAASNKS